MSKKAKTKNTQQEIEALREQLARVLADYDNLQKRISRQQEEALTRMKAQIITGFLPALDMLENVQTHLNDSGLAMALSELKIRLKEEGVEQIKPKSGDKFDENLHEAVEAVESKSKKGTVEKLNLTGYKINGYIIRPAKVIVSRGKEK